MADIDKSLENAVKTGKVLFGTKDALRSLKSAKAKAVVIASNCPKEYREKFEYYSELSKIPIILYDGTGLDLGLVCGKAFRITVLTIRAEGDSDILRIKVS